MELTRKQKIVFWVSLLFVIGIMLVTSISFATSGNDFIFIIPGKGGSDFLILIGVPLVVCMLLPFLIPNLTPPLVKLLRKFRRSTEIVHISAEPAPKFRSFMGRAVVPVLLIFSIANVLSAYISPADFGGSTPDQVTLNLGLLIAPIILMIMIIIWTIQDQGVGFWHSKKDRDVPVLEGVGHWLSAFLRGYAGISAIISYVQIVVITLDREQPSDVTASFFVYAGPFLALLGYFAYWGVTAVLYEKITVLNSPALLKKYNLPAYEPSMKPVVTTASDDPRTQ